MSLAGHLSQNVEIIPHDGFKKPDSALAPSTPGPRVCKVPNIYTPYSVIDSLRIINHLLLSDDDARYVRAISLICLAPEYSVKKKRAELLGNNGKGWVVSEKVTFKKWYRHETGELKHFKKGQPERKEVFIGKISKEDIASALQHWANVVTESGDFVEMQSLEHCPKVLEDKVIIVCGNDSGQGFCREGIRFCNRKNANSGGKIFVSAVMQGSDKSLSLFQKQQLFNSLSALRNLSTIQMGGKERALVKFSVMDYEAAAEDVGTQVLSLTNSVLAEYVCCPAK